MSKKSKTENESAGKLDLMAMASQLTAEATTKRSSGSGRTTYLDRFVGILLDENGQPTEPKSRQKIITEMTVDIVLEDREAAIAAGKTDKEGNPLAEFDLTKNEDGEFNTPADVKEYQKVTKRVKNMVAAAIAKNQNATSISFNEKYKDTWYVAKHPGGLVSLAPKADEPFSE